jgi:hypothetical protein
MNNSETPSHHLNSKAVMSEKPKTKVEEVWKDVVGLESLYEVSNCGRVRSIDRIILYGPSKISRRRKGTIFKTSLNSSGYPQVWLRGRSRRVHHLVMEAFVGPRPAKLQVNHIDANKQNNHIGNLEYCTCQYNIRHAVDSGLWGKSSNGERNHFAKLKNVDVLKIREMAKTMKTSEIAKLYPHMAPTSFWQIIARKVWKTV